MSGEKRRYVRLEERELKRLKEQESRLRSVQRDLPKRLNTVKEEARQEFQQRLATLEQRHRQWEQIIQKLTSGLKTIEKATQRRLQQQRQEWKKAVQDAEVHQKQLLQKAASSLESAMQQGFEQQRRQYLQITTEQRREYTRLIAQQDEKFTQLLTEERQAREQGQQLLQQQIEGLVENIEQERERKAKLAKELLSDVNTIWEQIDRDYQHQRYAPGRLIDLRRELEIAQSNIQTGVMEAAIASTQQTYLQLSDLRLELEQKEQEWLLLYNAAGEDLKSLIAEVQANRECEVEVGQEDEEQKYKLEVDYWVNGRLSQYEQQLSQLESQLKSDEATLSIKQLKDFGQKITALQPTLGEIVEQAKVAILSSQMRVEIADHVVEALDLVGYTLVNPESDAIYEGNDQRNAYAVRVKNLAGDEIVTVISPEREFGANSISINTFSPTLIDEKATQQNAKAILDFLEEQGVKGQGELECYEQARTEYLDMQAVKQRQTAPSQS